jgi:hypothetical protein
MRHDDFEGQAQGYPAALEAAADVNRRILHPRRAVVHNERIADSSA